MFTEALNFVFGPVLLVPPFFSVVFLSFLVSLISVVITKYATDQSVMKDLKEQLKAYQDQMKKLKENPEAAMDVQKKAMDVNMKYMMHNMRATLFTFLPIILIFGWMSGHLAYSQILPNQEFGISLSLAPEAAGKNISLSVPDGVRLLSDSTRQAADSKIVFSAVAEKEGEFLFDVTIDERAFSHVVVVGKSKEGLTAEKSIKQNGLQTIKVEYEPLKVIKFPFALPLFGEYFGWLGTYILFAIVFSMVLRKLMKVH